MKCVVIHGPNLNMLGRRDPHFYGFQTLDELNALISGAFPEIEFEFFQSNFEGEIIEKLHQISSDIVVMNPGGLGHYSVSLRDAFELVSIPKGVAHLSDILKREPFRHVDLLKDLADVYDAGNKENSYINVIKGLLEKVNLVNEA